MSDLHLSLTLEVRERLESVAVKMGCSVEDCARQAVSEFLDSWEDFALTIAALESGEEERPVLRAVNE